MKCSCGSTGIDKNICDDCMENEVFKEMKADVKAGAIAKVYSAKITISRATSNFEDDYMNFDIAIGNKHIAMKMNMIDYANTISGLARQPIEIDLTAIATL
jgi:hypothetical protein